MCLNTYKLVWMEQAYLIGSIFGSVKHKVGSEHHLWKYKIDIDGILDKESMVHEINTYIQYARTHHNKYFYFDDGSMFRSLSKFRSDWSV